MTESQNFGIHTFLFTDIADSSRLWQEFPAAYSLNGHAGFSIEKIEPALETLEAASFLEEKNPNQFIRALLINLKGLAAIYLKMDVQKARELIEEAIALEPAIATSVISGTLALIRIQSLSQNLDRERPKWFSPDGRVEGLSYRRNNIFEVVAEECQAVQERVGILDLSSFTKHDVTGPDAEAFLNRVCANRVSPRVGGIVLAHGLTETGRIESEYTITRLDDEHFYLLSAAAANIRNSDQLMQNKRHNEQVEIKNITDEWGPLVLAGPRTRDLLSKITSADLSNEHFPWLTGKEIEVAGVILRALRINYVGELGWELHVPIDQLVNVYDAVWAAGEEFEIADFGMYALSSLGKEKAYYAWGVELINEITMIEAGMERFVNFDKGDFVGREALLKRQKEQLNWKIAYVEVEAEDADVRGGEPAYDGDKVIGVTSSGSYGYRVEKSLAFVFVHPEYALPGTTFDIEILSTRRQAKVLGEAAYDPENKRLRA